MAIDEAHTRVIDRLVDARLLTTDEESVQLSHEALAREWPRLKEWLAADVEGQRIMRHLSSAAAAWDAMGRPDSELYRGSRLAAAQQWRDVADPALTAVEQEFLDASSAHESAELAAARRMVRRLSWVSVGAAGLALVAIAASLFGGFQASLAGERATVAEARRVAGLALEEPDFDRALLLAVEAIHIWDDPETRVNLVRVISRAPRLTSITRIPEVGVAAGSMSLAEDGTRASVIDSDGVVRLFDLDDRSQLAEYGPFFKIVVTSAIDPVTGAVAFSETSDTCTEARCDFRRIATLDVGDAGRSGVTTYEGLGGPATDVEYSADGSLFAALTATPRPDSSVSVALWRGGAADRTGPILRDLGVITSNPSSLPGRGLPGPAWQYSAVKFSPDGSRIYASGFGPTIVLDTTSGQELHRIPGTGILAVSPDGRRIAVRDGERAVRIVDSSGQAAPIAVTLSSFPSVADFSPDGTQLAIAAGNEVVVANAESGEVEETLQDHDGLVTAVEFRPTGELVTAGDDGAIITWQFGDWVGGLRSDLRDHGPAEVDERTVAREQSDGRWLVVVAEPTAWEERACETAGRALTEQEWAEFLGSRPYAPACGE
ncbi:WD40 repeat domain-containing protein [Microbacterium sp. NPDC019599]|uniref:WD40 repeat domain-containing protein n=1 Tax=Microbacterium sp. NPDC019599 TaxID=3154690 RepID=UPI0033D017C8